MLDETLVSRIYEAAAIPDNWPAVLGDVGRLVGASASGIISMRVDTGVRFLASPVYDAVYRRFAPLAHKYRNIRAERAVSSGYIGFQPDTELCTMEELRADPIYVETLYPSGLEWTIGSAITAVPDSLSYFDFARSLGDQPFSRGDAELLDSYRPTLARASLLATRLGLEAARSMAEAFSLLGLPAAVLDLGGKVIAANDEFASLAPRITTGAFDRIELCDPPAAHMLSVELQRLRGGSVAARSLPIRGDDRAAPAALHLIPIQREARSIFVHADVIAVVTSVLPAESPHPGLLAALFDLSPAEVRVARGIGEGQSLRQLALKLGVSDNTVRNQLAAVFAKTGTHRQTELVNLLQATRPLPLKPAAS